jgi:uncharacterized protein
MEKFKEFSLPIKGLKNGVHEFDFEIGDDFFKNFEGSPIQKGNFDVHVTLDKRDTFFELVFDVDGFVHTECDRCTANIELPFGDSHYLTVKQSLEENEEDAEVVYISPDDHIFNLAQYIYEFICLSVPYNKVYDCENDDPRPCDMEILRRIEGTPSVSEAEKPIQNPFDNLKNLFNSN